MILHEGTLRNISSNENYNYKIIQLNSTWLDKLFYLQEECVKNLKDTSLYYPLTRDELTDVLMGNGIVLGILVKEILVGFRVMSFLDDETKKLGAMIDLNLEQLKDLVFFESTIIKKDYRGNRLQSKMISLALKYFIKENRFHHFVSTVSPFNYPSLINLMRNDFVIKKLAWIYDNVPRYILYRSSNVSSSSPFNKTHLIDLYDLETQLNYFKNGYIGISIEKKIHKQYIKMIKKQI